MKHLTKLTLFLLTTLLSIGTISYQPVLATSITACDPSIYTYSVETLSYNSSAASIDYSIQACYTTGEYGAALSKFDEIVNGGTSNVVIKYIATDDAEFQSPLKIIRADRAMAYTQNFTYTVGDLTTEDGVTYASTIGIYNDAQLTSRYTYVDNKEPLAYYTTDLRNSSGATKPSNMVSYVQINGAKGYIKLTGIDIVPLIYAENRVLIPFYVKLSSKAAKTLYIRLNGSSGIYPLPPQYLVNNGEISVSVDRATTLDSIGAYAKAPAWLTSGTYYSADGIRFYTDMALRNPVKNGDVTGEFYSYYNYLSLRTKSNVTGAQLDQYLINKLDTTYKDGGTNDSVIINQGNSFINAQTTYGMNALLIYSMALLESAKGTSDIALSKKNIFSVNAVDSNTGLAYTFASIEEAVSMQMGIYLRYYMDINSTKFYGSNIGNKGAGFNTMYASDAFWSTKIANYAYQIDKSLGLNEYDRYSLALLKPSVSSTLYKDRNLTTSLYSIPTRAINYPVTLTAQYNNTYYTQSTSPIVNNQLVTNATSGLITYDWETSKAYISQNQVTLLNTATQELTVISDVDSLVFSIENFKIDSNMILEFGGFSALRNTNMDGLEVTHTLRFRNILNSLDYYDFNLKLSTPLYPLNLLNGFDYTNAWFNDLIDISTLPFGNYTIELITKAGDVTGNRIIFNSDPKALKPIPVNVTKDYILTNYRVNFNPYGSMRYELVIEKGLNFTSQNFNYPTRFYNVAFLNDVSIIEDQLILNGIAYIRGNTTNTNSSVSNKILLIDENGQNFIYDAITSSGLVNISHAGNDYSQAWFDVNINLNELAIGKYRIFVLHSSNGYTDAIELRNISKLSTLNATQSRKYNLNSFEALQFKFELTIE